MAKKQSHSRETQKKIDARTLQEILRVLGIREWDYLMTGDGSGNRWPHEIGFSCLTIERGTEKPLITAGTMSHGTNSLAELMAYVEPLLLLTNAGKPKRQPSGACRVHILSDSEYVVNCGNGTWDRKAFPEVWAMYDAFKRSGLFLRFHWIPGHEGIPANEFADMLASMARLAHRDVVLANVQVAFAKAGVEKASQLYPQHEKNVRKLPKSGNWLGWITAPEADVNELEKLGVQLGQRNGNPPDENGAVTWVHCLVPDNAIIQMHLHWGRWVWELDPDNTETTT